MTTETTINIHTDTLTRLSAAASHLRISKSELVSSLVSFYKGKSSAYLPSRIRVCYQERRDKECWRRLHLCLRRDEYDFFLDMRFVLKLSVSFIVSQAVELYLDELMQVMINNTDNYRYRNYAICQMYIDDVMCWVHYWGIPRQLLHPPPQIL